MSFHTKKTWKVQPVPEKMRTEMLVEMQIKSLDCQSSRLFLNEPFEKRPLMSVEDYVLHSDDHFASHLLGNGLYMPRKIDVLVTKDDVYTSLLMCTYLFRAFVCSHCVFRMFMPRQIDIFVKKDRCTCQRSKTEPNVYEQRPALQCVAVCCSVLQCVEVYCSVLQYAAVCI